MSGPSSRPKREIPPPRAFVPHPDDMDAVRAGAEEAERGEGVELTADQLEKWAETGELTCLESSSSRRGS